VEAVKAEVQDKLGRAIWYSMIKANSGNCECDLCRAWRRIANDFIKSVEV